MAVTWGKRGALAVLDVASWFLAAVLLSWVRLVFDLHRVPWSAMWRYALLAVAVHLVVGWVTQLYRGRYRVGSHLELSLLAGVTTTAAIVAGLTFVPANPDFPPGLAWTIPLGAIPAMALGRIAAKAAAMQVRVHRERGRERVLVYGAGNAGQQLASLIVFGEDAPYEVVGFLDDDPAKRNLHLGVGRVLGTGEELSQVAVRYCVHTIILAIPSAPASFLRRVTDKVDSAGLRLLTLPAISEIIEGQVQLGQVREVDVEDLLGRGQVRTNLEEVAGYLQGKVVLITGAGGSIGSEIARQVHNLGPSQLVLLDRDESGLHGTQLDLYGHALLNTPDMVLCDIRDAEALDRVFARHRPEVVFHAAALKHLPMLEMYPAEGWKTNVLGTLNVLECAARYGVSDFVTISTDKAADAISVLGKTKRKSEELTSWFGQQGCGTYLSVRFGNVLGSRGSVLHTFLRQIERGGPLTVVHPDIERYFMTIPEAVQLVIQAGAIGLPGDVLVLDMGEPVRILDVARRLIWKSGKDIDIVYTGLRPGEKLTEALFSAHEGCVSAGHPLINKVHVPPLDPQTVRSIPSEFTAWEPPLSEIAEVSLP